MLNCSDFIGHLITTILDEVCLCRLFKASQGFLSGSLTPKLDQLFVKTSLKPFKFALEIQKIAFMLFIEPILHDFVTLNFLSLILRFNLPTTLIFNLLLLMKQFSVTSLPSSISYVFQLHW